MWSRDAFEKKSGASKTADFRDIRLEDPAAKARGAWDRAGLLPLGEQIMLDTQYGSGLHSGGAEVSEA